MNGWQLTPEELQGIQLLQQNGLAGLSLQTHMQKLPGRGDASLAALFRNSVDMMYVSKETIREAERVLQEAGLQYSLRLSFLSNLEVLEQLTADYTAVMNIALDMPIVQQFGGRTLADRLGVSAVADIPLGFSDCMHDYLRYTRGGGMCIALETGDDEEAEMVWRAVMDAVEALENSETVQKCFFDDYPGCFSVWSSQKFFYRAGEIGGIGLDWSE